MLLGNGSQIMELMLRPLDNFSKVNIDMTHSTKHMCIPTRAATLPGK